MQGSIITIRLYLIPLLLFFVSCEGERLVHVDGKIFDASRSDVYLEYEPVHYKYAPKDKIAVQPDDEGKFSVNIPQKDAQLWFVLGEEKTPLFPQLSRSIHVNQVGGKDFEIDVQGYGDDIHDIYLQYVQEDYALLKAIREVQDDFEEGKVRETIDTYRTRVNLARNHLSDSPFQFLIHKRAGEFLTAQLRGIDHQRLPLLRAERLRQQVVREAHKLGFFSLPSLKAQRAGIRDFADAWSLSYSYDDSLEQAFGDDLSIYDIKLMAYQQLNEKRLESVKTVRDSSSLAYIHMYLVAERLGEAPFQYAEQSFEWYRENFGGYDKYASFLGDFHSDVKRIQPGQPAIPFQFADQSGNSVSLESLRGNIILLDFWAQWCSPCLDEFDEMRDIYADFNSAGFEIVAINIDADKETWEWALERYPNPWIQVYGGGHFDNELFQKYRGGGIPFYVLIDENGKILRLNDIRPSFNLREILEQQLFEPTASLKRNRN
jgi:thiol-disulfide isomerase/thioredoxin